MSVSVGCTHARVNACGGQRTAWGSLCSPSTMWVLGSNSGHQGLFGVSLWDTVRESMGFASRLCKPLSLGRILLSLKPGSSLWVFRYRPSGLYVILSRKESWSPHRGYFLVFLNWNRGLAWTHSQRGRWRSSHVDAWCMLRTGFLCLVCRVLTVTWNKQSSCCSC